MDLKTAIARVKAVRVRPRSIWVVLKAARLRPRSIWAATPVPLRPALMLSCYLLAGLLLILLRAGVAWTSGEPDRVGWGPLLGLSGCGIVAAVCFGVARAYLPLSHARRPWVLGMVASGGFWLCLLGFIALSEVRRLVPGDLAVVGIATLLFGAIGGFVLSLLPRS